jgi:hypothetical protein
MEGRGSAGRPRQRRRLAATLVSLAAAAACAWIPSASATSVQPTPFALAGGCYSLAPASTDQPIAAGSRLRLQATRLGSYLLFGTAKDFLAASGAAVIHAAQPSPAADWRVEVAPGATFTLSPASATDQVLAASGAGLALVPRDGAGAQSHFHFVPATGCAVFPEAELDVTGTRPRARPASGRCAACSTVTCTG